MTYVKYSDFLGSKSSAVDSEFCTVSIVNYDTEVSEEWHCHENFHLSAILQGGNLESRRKTDIQASPGRILVYHPGEIHRNRSTQFPSKNLNLEIKTNFLETYNLAPGKVSSTYWYSEDIYFNLIKIYHELAIQDRHTVDAIHASLLSVFSAKKKTNTRPSWSKKLHEIIEDRWDEFIPLKELAFELQVHPVTISKYFRKYCHCTLADYMRKIKVEKALHLLLQTKKPVTEIAFSCGFSDQSHMTRLFKFYVGFTPKGISRI